MYIQCWLCTRNYSAYTTLSIYFILNTLYKMGTIVSSLHRRGSHAHRLSPMLFQISPICPSRSTLHSSLSAFCPRKLTCVDKLPSGRNGQETRGSNRVCQVLVSSCMSYHSDCVPQQSVTDLLKGALSTQLSPSGSRNQFFPMSLKV